MNKYLFFLLTSCAVVAFSGSVNADNTILNTNVSAYTDLLRSVDGSYPVEVVQKIQSGTMTQDELLNVVSRSMNAEEQAAFLKNVVGEAQSYGQQASQLGNALTSSSSNIISRAQQMGISSESVAGLNNAISSINTTMDQFGTLSSEAESYVGTLTQDAQKYVGTLTQGAQEYFGDITQGAQEYFGDITQGAEGVIGDITGTYSEVTSIAGSVGAQITGAMELINNPQSLLTMGLGYVGWDQITNLSLGAAMDAVTDFMSSPTAGIPVTESSFIASNAADKAAKAQTGELDNKVSDEKQKQADAVGSRPSVPAAKEVLQSDDAAENPSLDSCPALMASYQRQTNKAYDFLKINYLDATPTVQHANVQKSMAAAVPYVESLLYLKKDDENSEKQIELQKKRDEYLADMLSDVLVSNIGVQQNLVEDAMSIPMAPTSGCNLIDDLNVSTMIMISTAKQLMADIALQIQLLEFEGIQRVANTEVVLLDKPEEKTEDDQ